MLPKIEPIPETCFHLMCNLCVCVSPAGSYFALSLFDRMWHPQLTEDEAIAMMEVSRGRPKGLVGPFGVWTRPAVGVGRVATRPAECLLQHWCCLPVSDTLCFIDSMHCTCSHTHCCLYQTQC